MDAFPHIYTSLSEAHTDGLLSVSSLNHSEIEMMAPPPQFGGPNDGHWTPEDMFCASISSCFILTFKSYTLLKKLEWRKISVTVEAYLDKVDKKLSFTKVVIKPTLEVCCEGNVDPYLEALKKSEEQCLVTNSINSKIEFIPKILLKAK